MADIAPLQLVTLYPHNFREVAKTLRHIADDVDAGNHGDVQTLAMVMLGDRGVQTFGIGPASSSGDVVIAFQAGSAFVVRGETDR